VLVVHVHALRAVNALHFVHEVRLHGLAAKYVQNLLRVLWALGQRFSRVDTLPVAHF